MNSPRKIVDRFREALGPDARARGERPDDPEISGPARWDEAARRLWRCDELLRQGLRSEALQLAETAPSLFGVLEAPGFPERSEWEELAGLLKEAREKETPLRELLRRHRRLALRRAPLAARIAVLRELAARDPANPVWIEDVRALEAARLGQIREEAAVAARQNDPEFLGRLIAEVEQTGWAEPPAPTLAASLRQIAEELRRAHDRSSLEEVVERMGAAHNADDPIRGRVARRDWARLARALALKADDPAARQVAPALDWLEDHDRRTREGQEHEAALNDLTLVLDNPGPVAPDVLEERAHAVLEHGTGMSDDLRRRYLARLRDAVTARARRDRAAIAGAAIAAALALVLIYTVVHAVSRGRKAEQAALAINDLVELGEPDQAAALLKQYETADPGLFADVRMIAARQRVEAIQERDETRALQFDRAMREAESAPLSAAAPPALERARSLARLETEKTAVENLAERRAARVRLERAGRDKDLVPRLDDLERSLGTIEQNARALAPGAENADNAAAVHGALADAHRTLAGLSGELAMASGGVRDRAQRLSERLDAVRGKLDQYQLRDRLIGAVTRAAAYSPEATGFSDAGPFTAALEAFARAFPKLPRGAAFARALKEERPLWDAVAAWDALAGGWAEENGMRVVPREAHARAELCRRFLVQYPEAPDAPRAETCRRAYEAVARRGAEGDGEGDGALGKLRRLLTDLLVDNLWTIKARRPGAGQSERYYLLKPPPDDFKAFSYLVGFDGKERTARVPRDWAQSAGVAPQTRIATRFKPRFAGPPERIDWETALCDLIDQIRAEPDMDPILQVALLRNVVSSAVAGSEPLRQALADFQQRLDQPDVDVNVPWMDPRNQEADRVRPKALELVRSLPDLAEARSKALAARARIEALPRRRPRSIGWLAHDADAWRIRTGAVLPRSGALWVVVPGATGPKRGAWRNIGAIEQARARLGPDGGGPALAEGRPVFVMPPEKLEGAGQGPDQATSVEGERRAKS